MSSLWDDLAFLLGEIRWREEEPCRHAIRVLADHVPPRILRTALDEAAKKGAAVEVKPPFGWLQLQRELDSLAQQSAMKFAELQTIQRCCKHANMPPAPHGESDYRIQCPDCGWVRYQYTL